VYKRQAGEWRTSCLPLKVFLTLPDIDHLRGLRFPGALGAEAPQDLFAHGGVVPARDLAELAGWGEGFTAGDTAFRGSGVVRIVV